MLGLEGFERDYHRRFYAVLVELMGVIDELESHLEDVNPSGVGSLGVEHSVWTGRDAREVMDCMGFMRMLGFSQK